MAKKHIHTYVLKDIGQNKPYLVYACRDCTHYLRIDMVEGKESHCNRCDKVFKVTKATTYMGHTAHGKRKYLICSDCRRKTSVKQETVKMMEKLGLIS